MINTYHNQLNIHYENKADYQIMKLINIIPRARAGKYKLPLAFMNLYTLRGHMSLGLCDHENIFMKNKEVIYL